MENSVIWWELNKYHMSELDDVDSWISVQDVDAGEDGSNDNADVSS